MAGRRRATGRRTPAPLPVNQPLVMGGRASRSARTARRRRQRRLKLVSFAVPSALLVLVGLVFVVRSIGPGDKATVNPTRTQRTLLVQLAAADRGTAAATLLAWDPTPKTASMMLLPPNTITEVPGYGTLPLRNALRLGGARVAREAASDLVGVLVDNDWTLDRAAFTKLVDNVGGVTVELDRDLVVPGPRRGTTVLIARAGSQRLDGDTAYRWATYMSGEEDELAALPRFQAVLESLLAALPDSPSAIGAAVAGLGRGATSSAPAAVLAAFLDGVRDADEDDKLEPAILPVTRVDVGGRSVSYSIKPDEVDALVEQTLAASVPPGRRNGNNRVLVQNGVGTPGIGQSVARRLTPQGFDVVATRNAAHFNYRKSVVLIFDGTDSSRAQGARVAQLLRLPPDSVQVATIGQSVADVIVIIGADYRR